MDPVSAFGLFTGAAQILHTITSTIKGLRKLVGKIEEAQFTILSLIHELVSMQAALTSLEEWLRVHRRDNNVSEGLDNYLAVAIHSCHTIMGVLSDEVNSLIHGNTHDHMSLGTRIKAVWKEDSMKGHQDMLHSQVLALQLLLSACQCHSSNEQIALLRAVGTRRIIDKVTEDTAELKSVTISRAGSDVERMSQNKSRNPTDDLSSEFEQDIFQTKVYQRALRLCETSSLHSSAMNRQSSTARPSLVVTPELPGVYRQGDRIYTTGNRPELSGTAENVPGLTNPMNTPTNAPRSQSQREIPRRPAFSSIRRIVSDSKAPPRLMPSPSRRERITSILGRLNTGSRMNLGLSASQPDKETSPFALEREYRRLPNLNTSIDLSDGSIAPIIKAAQVGTWTEVKNLITKGYDIEALHEGTGRSALLVAAHCGREDIVELLMESGANLRVADTYGETSLHLAAARGHADVVELLMIMKDLTEVPNVKGRTALRVATDAGKPKCVKILLEHRAKVNARAEKQRTALHAAAKRGDSEVLKLLLSFEADVEAKDGTMMTALHHACIGGHVKSVKTLLDYRANLEAVGFDKKTPLIYAAEAGKTEVVEYLVLRHNASCRAADKWKMTALHWAAFKGHEDTVSFLSKRKGSFALADYKGRAPLHLAVIESHFPVVELLHRRGAPLEQKCDEGFTALHYACRQDSFELAQLLVFAGANIEASSTMGQERPLHIVASLGGSKHIMDLLCDNGANLNAVDKDGFRPLCNASYAGHIEAMQYLLARESKLPEAPDYTPALCSAAKGGSLEAVSILLDRGASATKPDHTGRKPVLCAAHHGHLDIVEMLFSTGQFRSDNVPDLEDFASDVPQHRKTWIQGICESARVETGGGTVYEAPDNEAIELPTFSETDYSD